MLNTGKFYGKTIIISGASRGIGRAIALKLARDGANVSILAKTAEKHPKLPGTIYTVAEEVEAAGGKALPCIVDIRDEVSCQNAVEATVKKFGGIDICCCNASAISLTGTLETPMKRYDLMNSVNARGTFLLSQKCIPYLKQSKNPHILTMSPPLQMDKIWFANHTAYTISKYGMSMCVLGMSEEFKDDRIAVNALWPKTTIWTAAMEMLSGGNDSAGSRTPDIVADAAYAIFSRSSKDYTGNFVIDEEVLQEEGVQNFDKYACKPGVPLSLDFFIPGSVSETFNGGRTKSREVIKAGELDESIERLKHVLNDPDVKKLKAVYEFKVKEAGKLRIIYMDLAKGKLGQGSAENADVIFESDAEVFIDMLNGKLKPSNAFMTQSLKIRGNVAEALKLEKALGKLQQK